MATDQKKKPAPKSPTDKQLAEIEAVNERARNAGQARKALAALERCKAIDPKTCDELVKAIEARRDKETPA